MSWSTRLRRECEACSPLHATDASMARVLPNRFHTPLLRSPRDGAGDRYPPGSRASAQSPSTAKLWEESVSEPQRAAKPFVISKRMVWEAWRRVRANQGAAGVDGQSIKDFEADLEGNLYKLWNRLSSGSYMPPLPVPADLVAQTHRRLHRPLGDAEIQTAERQAQPRLGPTARRPTTAAGPVRPLGTPAAKRWMTRAR